MQLSPHVPFYFVIPQFSNFAFQPSQGMQNSNSCQLDFSHKKHEIATIICIQKTVENKGELCDFQTILNPAVIIS